MTLNWPILLSDPGHGQKGPMNNVCPYFFQEDILELTL